MFWSEQLLFESDLFCGFPIIIFTFVKSATTVCPLLPQSKHFPATGTCWSTFGQKLPVMPKCSFVAEGYQRSHHKSSFDCLH